MRMNKEWSTLRPVDNSSPEKRCESNSFWEREEGSFTVLSLFLLLIMLIVSGMAVDLMHTESRRVRLQSTMDRAVLAGASLEQSLNSKDVVQDYFDTAGLGTYLEEITVVPGAFSKTVSATARTDVGTFFLSFLGINTLPALSAGTAREGVTDIEVSLVLDISGSMLDVSASSGNRKIDDMIAAAQEFVYLIQCNPDAPSLGSEPCVIDPGSVSINLIPYNEQVLVGEDLIQHFNITNEHNLSSCVDFDHHDYFDAGINTWQNLLRTGTDDWQWWWNPSQASDTHKAKPEFQTCRDNPYAEVRPLMDDWTVLNDRIGDLVALGGTSIEMGMKWGVALLDPAFNDVTADLVSGGLPAVTPMFGDRPTAYGTSGVKKFVLLMTDGENTWHHALKSEYRDGPSEIWYDADDDIVSVFRESQSIYINPFTGVTQAMPFGDTSVQLTYPQVWERFNTDFFNNGRNFAGAHNWLPNPVNETNGAQKNANLVAMCEAARNKGIEVFTVGFETSPSSSSTMKKCASSHAHHFDVDGIDLDDAFAAIARKIQVLRLIN